MQVGYSQNERTFLRKVFLGVRVGLHLLGYVKDYIRYLNAMNIERKIKEIMDTVIFFHRLYRVGRWAQSLAMSKIIYINYNRIGIKRTN